MRRPAIRFMTAETLIFVDTNVLVYARDHSAGDKHAMAVLWLDRLANAERMLLNMQVLNELTRWMLRKERTATATARDAIEMLREFGEAPLLDDDVERAWDIRETLGYQWFDCLLIASAANAGCSHFLSEDMGHETRYGSLTIINPFRVDPDSFLSKN
jgi:predicted nucleic acid-binding protein